MQKETTIHVHKRKEPFAMVPKSVLNDQTLSWKAKGILAYLLGKPNKWKVRITDLVNRGADRFTAVKSGLTELRDSGYAQLECVRENGRFIEWRWHVADYRQFKNVNNPNAPEAEDQPVENRPVEKPRVGKQMLPIMTGSKIEEVEKKTTTKRAADAASGDGVEIDLGSCFSKAWCMGYQQWFKTPYLQKNGEAVMARKIIEGLKCRPKDLLAYAYRMWINTTDFDEVNPDGFDPMFYQIKGSRNLRFFLSHLMEIAVEQDEPTDCAIPVREPEFRQLEQVTAQGRPD